MMMRRLRKVFCAFCCLWGVVSVRAGYLLLPMDGEQSDHLRAYGVTYRVLEWGHRAEWLLNYRGGSFLLPDMPEVREYALAMGVSYEPVADPSAIYAEIASANMNRIVLDKAPKVAVYVPPTSNPWDDAVSMALIYANIPYDKVWDEEVLAGALSRYDWLHLHHEDFTGQFGKFYGAYRHAEWYQDQVAKNRRMAEALGFPTVPRLKATVARMIQAFVAEGGFLFAMCAATDTLDIALAAEGVDIVAPEIDGTPVDPDFQSRLDFTRTFCFHNFRVDPDPYRYEFSDIDVDPVEEGMVQGAPPFQLFEFSAKEDPVPCMLVQNHVVEVKDFLGQTTAFREHTLKPEVTVLGMTPGTDRVKYVHRGFGRGTVTFLGGHDPEDYRHLVGDPPTDLSLHRNSPGYRLILNNVLFPAARKEKRKT